MLKFGIDSFKIVGGVAFYLFIYLLIHAMGDDIRRRYNLRGGTKAKHT